MSFPMIERQDEIRLAIGFAEAHLSRVFENK